MSKRKWDELYDTGDDPSLRPDSSDRRDDDDNDEPESGPSVSVDPQFGHNECNDNGVDSSAEEQPTPRKMARNEASNECSRSSVDEEDDDRNVNDNNVCQSMS